MANSGLAAGSPRILLVDDDREFCELLTQDLGREHLQVEVALDGLEGLERVRTDRFDLVLLDIMLPKLGGLEVLRRIRATSQVPILILSARGEDVDRIVGLEMGADDYVGKPFNPRELLARIHAILRRSETATNGSPDHRPAQISVGDVHLDEGTRVVTCRGSRVELTAVEFDLLELLLTRTGTVVSRDELSLSVLGREFSPIDRSIDIHVSRLRRKLGSDPRGSDRIKTLRGVGYMYLLQGSIDE